MRLCPTHYGLDVLINYYEHDLIFNGLRYSDFLCQKQKIIMKMPEC